MSTPSIQPETKIIIKNNIAKQNFSIVLFSFSDKISVKYKKFIYFLDIDEKTRIFSFILSQ
jgi:hypothetical protein